ncbi:UDP-N-acetylmuramoyl-L-alanine--D-glutamate ligase [Paludicola sp. MB14-C6]|uniref:UDP-N-acetylmuramoyl-L-alanine--D-glutamate ligase n=1 Tax=Paludihabitans sp. MB14-C6 TaxID=3070656 RepID=UPI0027DD74FA|nr:UDP-N-acetylmuramoyl-L-alanine--D-glutamate ligase [Paludicola sp. MB14-C6]WMJ23880.1 UDP-N-acetylmuramoyl-L-alanine--D-glutamate ligase [Paludicola sp. MB14-C6]
MYDKIAAFYSFLKTKKVAFIGLGVSHNDLIKLMLKKGIDVTLLDKREADAIGEQYNELKDEGANFCLGNDYLASLTDYDVVFRSPGVYFFKDELIKARKNGVVITSEMEVFFDLCPCKIYAVTGSDGKTTTTTLISEMLKVSGKTVYIGGNIGKALLPLVEEMKPEDVCTVELSSFQLISMRQSPDVAVVTNIAPNHLDVHKDMQEYIDCKANLLAHQNAFSKTVLNLDNELGYSLEPYVRGQLSCFSRQTKPKEGTFLDENGNLCKVHDGNTRILFNKLEIRLPGIHNVENYLAAIAAVGDEVSDQTILKVAREFGGVEHRIEFVREIDGVKYYNDSIASSPTRTIAGLNSFEQKMIIIAGGYDKKIPYEPLGPVLVERAKILILLGATAPKIEKAVRDCENFETSGLQIVHVSTLEEAVAKARELAQQGDVVSLSPASASFDLYKNFEERGKHFKRIVNEMQ